MLETSDQDEIVRTSLKQYFVFSTKRLAASQAIDHAYSATHWSGFSKVHKQQVEGWNVINQISPLQTLERNTRWLWLTRTKKFTQAIVLFCGTATSRVQYPTNDKPVQSHSGMATH